jgi:hypothetical protein
VQVGAYLAQPLASFDEFISDREFFRARDVDHVFLLAAEFLTEVANSSYRHTKDLGDVVLLHD